MRRPGTFITSFSALALVALTQAGCAHDSRDRHFAMRAATLRPEPGSGTTLAQALPPEGLFADSAWASADHPTLFPEQ